MRRFILPNFFFLSSKENITFYHTKCSIKFDNKGLGKARISLKFLLQKEEVTENPEIYLYIQNIFEKIKLEHIDDDYNGKLKEKAFRNAAGKEKIDIQNIDSFFLTEIDLIECPIIHNKKAILLDRVIINEIESIPDISHLPRDIFNEGILLKITPILNEKIKDVELQKNLSTTIFEFQCRIFLKNFLSKDTLTSWKSSSEPWSTILNILLKSNIGKKYEKIENYLINPKYIDLWITIPHGHLFNASSPVYASAIKLKREDIEYKTYEGEKRDLIRYYKQFETQNGDYSVRIKQYDDQAEDYGIFSIICTSPFLPEETPSKLREDINEFKEKSEELVQFERHILRNMVGIFGIFVAIFSFITIGANTVLSLEIPVDLSILQVFLRVSAIFTPIFLFLILLLIISYFFTKK